MNVFTGIMLVFAIVGFADKTFSLRWGLSSSFDKGLATMGTMVIPIVGVCTIGVEFIERQSDGFVVFLRQFIPILIICMLIALGLWKIPDGMIKGFMVLGKIIQIATSLAILPLFDRMDDKGRLLNCAFSISGAYVIGGSMAFVSAVSSGYVVLIFLVCKLVSGFLSMFVAGRSMK